MSNSEDINNTNQGLNSISVNTNPQGSDSQTDVQFLPTMAAPSNSGSVPQASLGFVSSDTSPNVPGIMSSAASASKMAAEALKEIASGNIAGAAGALGGQEAADLLSDISVITGLAQTIYGALKGGGSDGSDLGVMPPPPDGGEGNGGSNPNTNRLDIDPHPVEITWSTDIKPNAYTPEWNTTDGGYSHVYQCTSALLQFPATNDISGPKPILTSGNLYNAMNNELNDIRSLIQRNVSFSVKTVLETTDILTAINSLTYALQVYFAATRYTVYAAQPTCRNEAIKAIANSMTSQEQLDYIALRNELMSCPKPPKLVEMCYWFMQLYRSGESSPLSTVLSVNPFKLNTTTGQVDWSCISAARTKLIASRDNWAIIGTAIPSWYATGLPTSAKAPVHSLTWNTVFQNLPSGHKASLPSAHDIISPWVSNDSSQISYTTTTDTLDGGAYGLTSIAYAVSAPNTTNVVYAPSLISPIFQTLGTSDAINRYTWVTDRFQDTYYLNGAVFARNETYTFTQLSVPNPFTYVNIGSQRVKGVSVEAITNSASQLITHIFDIKSLPTKDISSKLNGPALRSTKPPGSRSGNNSSYRRKKKGGK